MKMAKIVVAPKFGGIPKYLMIFCRDSEYYVELLGGRNEMYTPILLCILGSILDEGPQTRHSALHDVERKIF